MTINTVLGSIPDEQTGAMSLNEYVRLGLPGWDLPPECDYDESAAFRQAKERLLAFKQAGGSLIVDNSGIAMGRRADFLQTLSRVTGVHIVASTGFPDELGTPGHFYPERRFGADPEIERNHVKNLFVNELTLGMVTDGMKRVPIKPGLIRTGYGQWPMSLMEDLCHRAAARASKETGAAVYSLGRNTHIEALELLLSEGAAPERIVIGHCDEGPAGDPQRDCRIAQTGAYVAYDMVGWQDPSLRADAISDTERVKLVLELLNAGFKERILLSGGSVACRLDHEPTAPHGYEYLLNSFVPRLRAKGVSESVLKIILEQNPRRVLSFS